MQAGRSEEAKAALMTLLRRQPAHAQANKLMAMIHGAHEQYEQALVHIQRAAAAAPGDAEAHWMLGNVCMILLKHKEGAAAYRRVLDLVPGDIQAGDNLAKCLISMGEEEKAVEVYEATIRAHPEHPAAYCAAAGTYQILGRLDDALAVLRRARERLPDNEEVQEQWCYALNFPVGVDPVQHRKEHERLGALISAKAGPERDRFGFPNPPDPERPLRVAFLSSDLAYHPCAFFLEGPVAALDRSRIVPFWYANVPDPDDKSTRLATLAEWRNVRGLDDAGLAARATQDGIDIVVECNGWSAGHRLTALARRIAPVQVTYLGYPNTTGIGAMDYRLIDALTDPPGSEPHCTEALLRLPGCFLCFTPQEPTPEPAMTPALRDDDAPITFGSLNRPNKFTNEQLRCWGELMRRVPGARLLLNARVQRDDVKSGLKERLAAAGVDPSRVKYRPFTRAPGAHMAAYHDIDISLDSFPYNGTTTTCESLWMGVPVVALAGETHRARVGVSLLAAVGLSDLAAGSIEGYIGAAAGLAADRGRLRELRSGLRGRMRAGPLCDRPGFARGLEKTLRRAWKEWCARRAAR